jgi:hypothetical protein
MSHPEVRSSAGARTKGRFDGVSGLISYLLFTSLDRHAPALARGADRLGQRWRGRAWLTGRAETDRGPVDIAYLGAPDTLSHWLLDRLGVEPKRIVDARRTPGSVPCAVEFVMIPAQQYGDWARAGWIVLPRYVRHRQALRGVPSEFESEIGERVARDGVTLRFTQSAGELDRFQRDLYDPMLDRRHGQLALRTGRALLRLGQKRGGLLVAEAGGRALAGAVAAPSSRTAGDLEIWALGVAADAPKGAGSAPVLGWVRWARERRFAAVDHLASLPLYSDGLTRQKLRWGTELLPPSESQELVAMRVHGSSPAVKCWFGRHSFAACSYRGVKRVDIDDPNRLEEVARALALG